nr:ATP-binding protein [uncultured Acetatifactor sp.]
MYEVVNGLLGVFSAMFQGCCLQHFFGSFLEGRIRGRHAGLWTVFLYAVLKLGMDLILPSDYGSVRIFAKLALTLCILTILAVCCYRAAGKIKVFLVVAFLATGEFSFFLAYNVCWLGSNLYSVWMWCAEKGYIASIDVFDGLLKATTLGISATMHIVSIVILFVSLKSIVRSFREKDYAIRRMELLFILAPSMTAVFICTLLRMVLVTIEDGIPASLYDRYPSLTVMVPVVLLLSFLSILFGVKLFQDMIYWNREKSSRIILEKQVSSLQEHMGEMERVYSGIRGMRHDMKNTISVIMQLAAGKEEGLQAYLEELSRTMDRLEFRFKTGNTVVDTLLNMKYHEIAGTVPDLRMDVEGLQFPEKLSIQSYDIGIILGNALDNAIEACRKLKAIEPDAEAFIRISSFQKRELFFLKVENSFDGRVVRRPQNEFPMTDKADRENHGIGMVNIKSTAEKYQGTMDFKVNGRVFILSVMMKNERREEDGFRSDR